MTVRRMDHVGLVVDDLGAATAFFVALGLEPRGEAQVAGSWVDRIVGLDGIEADIAMLGTPGGDARIELVRFRSPPAEPGDPGAGSNVLGLRHLSFEVDDVAAAVAALRPHGGELVGEIVDHRDVYRLCYVRGPAGVIVELAEPLG